MSGFLSFSAFLAINFIAALTGALFKPGEWYEELAKPGWTPSNWVFPMVWSVLYFMIAISGWLVWRGRAAAPDAATLALAAYGVNLVFNAAWSWIFFGLRRVDWAMAELVLFWVSLVVAIALIAQISSLAAWLLAPYLIWVTIAAALNYQIMRLNAPVIANA